MKTYYRYLIIFVFLLLSNGCEKHVPDNPYDPGYSPDKWMPQNLKVSLSGQPTATLTWDMSIKLYDKVCIDRKRQDENWETKIASMDKTTNIWLDNTLIPDKSKPYEYRVYAVAGDNESSFTFVTYTPGIPVPGNPQVNKISERKYKFTWNQAEEGLDILERKAGEATWTIVKDSIPANQTFSSDDGKNSAGCFDENVPLNQSVYYRVCRLIKGIKSAYSEFNQVNTQLNSPGQLAYVVLNDTTIQLQWSDSSKAAEGCRLYREVGVNNDTWTLLKELPKADVMTFTDRSVPLDERVSYYVSTYFQNTETPSDTVFSDPGFPEVKLGPVQNITESSATCVVEVTSLNRSALIANGVIWSTNSNPTWDNNLGSINNGTTKGAFIDTITGLSPGTTYYVRGYAVNNVGTSFTDAISFVTKAADTTPPAVVSYTPSGTTTINPTVSLTFDEDVQLGTGTIKLYQSSDNTLVQTIDASSMSVSGNTLNAGSTANLEYGTAYYLNVDQGLIKDMSSNVFAGIGDNSTWTFTTEATQPTVTTDQVTDTTTNSATCGGNVTYNGGATVTEKGVCWSTSPNPTIADSKTVDGSGTGAFTSSITGLSASTTYYVRAYATNSVGTTYGGEVNFITATEVISYLPISGNIDISKLTLFDSDVTTVSTSSFGTNFDGFNTFETQNGLYGVWHVFRSYDVISGTLKFNQNSGSWESSTDTDVSTVYAPSSNQLLNFFNWNGKLYELGCSATIGSIYSRVYDETSSSWVSFTPSMDGESRFQTHPSVYIDASNTLHGVFNYSSGTTYPVGVGSFYFDPSSSPTWQRIGDFAHEYISTLQTGIQGKWLFFWNDGTTFYIDEYDPATDTSINKLAFTINDSGKTISVGSGTLFKQNNEIYLSLAYTPSGDFQTDGSPVNLGIMKIADLSK